MKLDTDLNFAPFFLAPYHLYLSCVFNSILPAINTSLGWQDPSEHSLIYNRRITNFMQDYLAQKAIAEITKLTATRNRRLLKNSQLCQSFVSPPLSIKSPRTPFNKIPLYDVSENQLNQTMMNSTLKQLKTNPIKWERKTHRVVKSHTMDECQTFVRQKTPESALPSNSRVRSNYMHTKRASEGEEVCSQLYDSAILRRKENSYQAILKAYKSDEQVQAFFSKAPSTEPRKEGVSEKRCLNASALIPSFCPDEKYASRPVSPLVNQFHNLRNLKMKIISKSNCASLEASTATSAKASKEFKLSDFQLGSCKGEGRFGKVYPALHKASGFLLALKQIKKDALKLMEAQFAQQLKIQMFISHPNIVKTYGFFHTPTTIYIMMEYMEEGSLYQYIKKQKKLSLQETSVKLKQICKAVKELHHVDVLHRDIKPENIVMTNGICKLCDFGWAVYSNERRKTYCGTLDYVCPQILEGESYDNFVDIWAVGVMAYEMLTGKAPFYHISKKQTMKSIIKCDLNFPAEVNMEAREFILKALQKQATERFTIESLLEDPFLRGTKENQC